MTQEELIAKIKAEIECRIKKYRDDGFGCHANSLEKFLPFFDTLESKKPTNPEDAMKELNEKIALVKQRGTWDGVDVDKYMDEVRGREPEKPTQEGLEEEYKNYVESDPVYSKLVNRNAGLSIARHFAKWGSEHLNK